jgi:sucrose-6F-phosphate phosphohydrolase
MKLERLLICTDLDRTLIPNGAAAEPRGARAHFSSLAGNPQVTLVYVSGRHRELVEAAIREYDLPVPDHVIGDVGTTIYRVGDTHAWQPDADWEREIAADWNGLDHAALADELSDLPELRPQEPEKQNRFKLSYYLAPDADRKRLSLAIESRLAAIGANARQIWSIDEATATGLLDVLPARVSKRHAIHALMREWAFTAAETVFCGDSGNDLEVLASSIPAVLVANSTPEFRAQALEAARDAGFSDRLYLAHGGFMGMNGNYAGGILEGIAHYFPESVAWMGFETEVGAT